MGLDLNIEQLRSLLKEHHISLLVLQKVILVLVLPPSTRNGIKHLLIATVYMVLRKKHVSRCRHCGRFFPDSLNNVCKIESLQYSNYFCQRYEYTITASRLKIIGDLPVKIFFHALRLIYSILPSDKRI